jgi:putative transposase
VAYLGAGLECSRSSYYARSQPKAFDPAVVAAVEQAVMRYPFYGYRRVGMIVGERRVRGVFALLGHSRNVGPVRVHITDSQHPHPRYPNRLRGLDISAPDHVWVADMTLLRFGTRFWYLAVVLDAYTRAVRGWALSRSLAQQLTLDALDMALSKGSPLLFHSDQGSQDAAWLHTERLLERAILISRSDPGKPTQNGIAERFMRTLKEEHVDYSDYPDFDDARHPLKHWLEVEYTTKRVHSALDYRTPAEFEALALSRPDPLLNVG